MFVYIFTYWSWCQLLNRSSTWSEAEVQNIEISITHPPSAIQHCRHTTDTRLALAGTKMQKCAACKDFLSRDKSPPGDPVTRDPSGYLYFADTRKDEYEGCFVIRLVLSNYMSPVSSVGRHFVYRASPQHILLHFPIIVLQTRLSTVCQYFCSPKLLSLTGPSASGRSFTSSTKS